MKTAFLGLGLMGRPMVQNLLKSDVTCSVYNRTMEKTADMDNGVVVCATPQDAVKDADIVITMLSNPEAVRDLAVSESGFIDSMTKGSLWIDCSTVNPSFAKHMNSICKTKGIQYIDAPVMGTTTPAQNGELLFLIGGEEEDIARAQPLFDIMGKKSVHLGGPGAGSAMKMIYNMMLGHAMASLSEAFALGSSMGIEENTLTEMIMGSPVAAPFLEMKRQKIQEKEFSPQFPLKWMQKDLFLALTTAHEHGQPLPVTSAVKELFTQAYQRGFGDLDFSVLVNHMANRKEMHYE